MAADGTMHPPSIQQVVNGWRSALRSLRARRTSRLLRAQDRKARILRTRLAIGLDQSEPFEMRSGQEEAELVALEHRLARELRVLAALRREAELAGLPGGSETRPAVERRPGVLQQ